MKKRIIRILLFLILLSVIIFYIGKPKQVKKETAPEMTLINKSRELAGKFYNANDIIRKFANYKDCDLSSSCIEISNPVMEWYGTYNTNYPISLSNQNLLKVSFKNQKETAGINFIGQYAQKNNLWWKERYSLNIGIFHDELSAYLDTGTKEEPVHLFTNKVNLEETGFVSIMIIFDEYGKKFTFLESNGTLIKQIDIGKDFNKYLPNGVFSNKTIHLGVFVSPLSQLIISNLYIIPLI